MTVSSLKPNNGSSPNADKLIQYLKDHGARLEQDEQFAKNYRLDFTLVRLENVFAHVNLGVHLNTAHDDLDAMEAFSQVTKRGLVLKSLYIEIDEETLDAGGLMITYGACLSYLFDKRHSQTRQSGLRVFEDCSFQFFDMEEAIGRLKRQSFEQDTQIGEDMNGHIIAYFTDKGFGFIQTDDERKFFFHIANIVDDELRGRLPSYVPGEIIPVDFQYGGNDGKKYPKAINVSYPSA